jgi:hypothetical protein
MAWTSLNALILTQAGDYSPLPTGAAGREITIRLPAFPAGEVGSYKIGIYSGTAQNPAFIADSTALIAPYQRHVRFQVPSNTFGLLLGVQLLTHEDLGNAIFDIVPEVLITQESSAEHFPGALSMALTLSQVVELVSSRLSESYATYEEFAELLTGIELSVISLRQALELEIEGTIDALREELDMAGIGTSATSTVGNAALITLTAPGPGLQYEITHFDFSYNVTPNSPGLLTITTDAGATVIHSAYVTASGEGPVPKFVLTGANKAVAIQLSGIAGAIAKINTVHKVVAA